MFTQSDWEPILRRALEVTNKAINRLVEKFAPKLQEWLDDLLNHPIPEDWRDELATFVQRTADDDNLAIAPHSIAALERLIEARIAGTRRFAKYGPARRTAVRPGASPQPMAAIASEAAEPPAETAKASNGESSRHREPEHRFVFVADKSGASRGYRKAFRDATPGLPDSFEVHHVFEKGREILAERFRKELKIDLNDLDNLRGVSENTHDEIDAIQTKFWAAKAKQYGGDTSGESYRKAYKQVPLEEVRKLQTEIEATYKSFWVKSGATPHEIAAVEKRLKNERLTNLRPSRIEGTLKKIGLATTGFAIFTMIADNAALANNIADPPKHVQAALDNMLKRYAGVYEARINRGFVKQDEWQALQDATMKYLNEAGFDNKVKALILREFELEGAKLSGS